MKQQCQRRQLAAAKKAPAAAAATDGDVPVAAPASSVDWCRSRSENHGKKPDDIPLLTQHSSRSVFFWARRYSERKTLSCRCLLRITSDRGSVGRDRFIRPSIPPGCETRQESLRKCLRSQRRVRLFIRLRPIHYDQVLMKECCCYKLLPLVRYGETLGVRRNSQKCAGY